MYLFVDSLYRDEISKAILRLQEQGELHKLKVKWWRSANNNTDKCEVTKQPNEASELGIKNVGGVFVILLAGLILSFAVAILEFVWKARKASAHYRVRVLRWQNYSAYCSSNNRRLCSGCDAFFSMTLLDFIV